MKLMNRKNNRYQAQFLVWELSPSRKSGRKIAGKKEGFHLPGSVEEDVKSQSLMPEYSAQQLRAMSRQRRLGKKQAAKSAKSAWGDMN